MENLGIDGKLLVEQLINFALFFIIFKKYVAKPFLKFLNQEKQKEKEKEELLRNLQKGQADLINEESAMKNRMRKDASELIARAKRDAVVVKNEILADAKKEAEIIKAKAGKEIEEERNKLYQKIREKVATLSMLVLEKALREYLDEESKKRITREVLTNLSNSVSKNEN